MSCYIRLYFSWSYECKHPTLKMCKFPSTFYVRRCKIIHSNTVKEKFKSCHSMEGPVLPSVVLKQPLDGKKKKVEKIYPRGPITTVYSNCLTRCRIDNIWPSLFLRNVTFCLGKMYIFGGQRRVDYKLWRSINLWNKEKWENKLYG